MASVAKCQCFIFKNQLFIIKIYVHILEQRCIQVTYASTTFWDLKIKTYFFAKDRVILKSNHIIYVQRKL